MLLRWADHITGLLSTEEPTGRPGTPSWQGEIKPGGSSSVERGSQGGSHPHPAPQTPKEAFIDRDAVGPAPGSSLNEYSDHCGSNAIPASISLWRHSSVH